MTITLTQEEQDLLNYIIEDYILGANPRDAGPAQKLKIKLIEPDWGKA